MRGKFSSTALKFLLYYLIIGIVWIIASDYLLLNLLSYGSLEETIEISSIKGILFVVLSASFFFFFLRKYEISNNKLLNEVKEKNYILKVNQEKFKDYFFQIEEWKNRYEAVLFSSDQILYDFDSNTKKVVWGGSFTKILGYKLEEVDSSFEWWLDKIHNEDRNAFLEQVEETHSSMGTFQLEYKVRKSNGDHIFVEDKGYLIKDKKTGSYKVIGLIKDITEQKNHQQLLEFNEQRYRHLVEHLPAGAVLVEKGNLFFNKATERITGYSNSEIPTIDDWFKKLYQERYEAIRELYEEDRLHNFNEPRNINIIAKNGEVKHIIFVVYAVDDGEVWLVQDVTHQKRVEEKLLSSIILGEDRERKRVAKELHDGLGQYLTAANLNLNSVIKDIKLLPSSRQEQFFNGMSFLREAIDETRNIAQNLMPKAIDDYGLIIAIESLIAKLMNLSPVSIMFNHNMHDLVIPKNLEINLYRITQELLNNALKHSNSKKITIQLMKHFDIFIFTYEDDGVGFEPEVLESSEGLGITNIKNRIFSVGGNLDIDSKKGRGTSIVISIPFNENTLVPDHANQYIIS